MSTELISAISPQLFERGVALHYVLFGAYTFLLLEHLAYIPEEIEIWKSSWNVAKFFFLIYRYSAVAGLTLIMHMTTGITDDLDVLICKRIVAAVISMVILSMTLADTLVVLRVSVLWGRHRSVLVLLALALVFVGAAAITCSVLLATQLVAHMNFISFLNMCVPIRVRSHVMFGVWIPGIAFDILVLTLTSYNAFSRPRDYRTKLTRTMYRDGIMYFLILSSLRLTNLLIALFGTQFTLFSVCFTWAFSAATLSRFVFHLRSVEEGTPSTESQLSFGPGPGVNDDGEALAQMPRLERLSVEVLPMRPWSGGHGARKSQSRGSSSAGRSDFSAK